VTANCGDKAVHASPVLPISFSVWTEQIRWPLHILANQYPGSSELTVAGESERQRRRRLVSHSPPYKARPRRLSFALQPPHAQGMYPIAQLLFFIIALGPSFMGITFQLQRSQGSVRWRCSGSSPNFPAQTELLSSIPPALKRTLLTLRQHFSLAIFLLFANLCRFLEALQVYCWVARGFQKGMSTF
jgi:hypothetical protein